MCMWNTPKTLTINGVKRDVDACIAPIVEALNAAGIETVASCCGHGWRPGRIDMKDGRCLYLITFEAAQQIDMLLGLLGTPNIQGESGYATTMPERDHAQRWTMRRTDGRIV